MIVRDAPQQVAVVYFVDPDGEVEAPVPGAEVRVVGRFYKVWLDTDAVGEPTRYLTFIAKYPVVSARRNGGAGSMMGVMLGLILLLSAVFFLLRRMGRGAPRRLDRAMGRPGMGDQVMLSGPAGLQEGDHLPDSPAEALRQMAQHSEQD